MKIHNRAKIIKLIDQYVKPNYKFTFDKKLFAIIEDDEKNKTTAKDI